MSLVDYSETNPSPEVRVSRHARGGLYIVATASLLFAMLSIMNCVELNMRNGWIKADASLVKAVIEDTGRGKELKVSYLYKVGSKTIRATEAQRGEDIRSLNEKSTVSDEEVLQRAKNDFDKNKNFPVYYNPSSPAESRIADCDFGKLIACFAFLAGACVCIFIASVWVLLHPRKPSIISTAYIKKTGNSQKKTGNSQAILDSLSERSTKVDAQANSGLTESAALDASATENSLDGATINVKKSEKETL